MDLSIDYAKTRALGNAIIEKGNDFGTILGKINTENSNLRTYWQGEDAKKYIDAVSSEIENMKILRASIDEIGQYLIDAANAYEKVNESNLDGFY